MCINNCFKKKFEPRTKKTGPYQKTNAYTTRLSCEQIVTLILFVIQVVLHSVFVIPPMDDIGHAVLWVLLAFHYLLLLGIAYDYLYLTLTDPVDPLVLNE